MTERDHPRITLKAGWKKIVQECEAAIAERIRQEARRAAEMRQREARRRNEDRIREIRDAQRQRQIAAANAEAYRRAHPPAGTIEFYMKRIMEAQQNQASALESINYNNSFR